MRCLFSTGSKCDGRFSLSSEGNELENGSLEKVGVEGVSGISSDTSDNDVVELIGVVAADTVARFGVTGSEGSVWGLNRPPCR